MTTIVTDKQQLVAKTNNKLTGLALNGSFSSLLGLKQPSLSSSCLQERVNEGCGQRFGGVAKILRARFARVWLSTSLPQILDTPQQLETFVVDNIIVVALGSGPEPIIMCRCVNNILRAPAFVYTLQCSDNYLLYLIISNNNNYY